MATDPKVTALVELAKRLSAKLPSGEGHAATRQVLGATLQLTEAARALHNLRTTRNPTETEGAHQKRVSLAAERLGRETTSTINRITSFLRAGHADLSARIAEKTKLTPDSYAAEIRAVYRSMTQAERAKLLSDLVDGGRGPELAALANAPPSLTGMSPEHRQQYLAAFIAHNAPAESAEAALLDEVYSDALVSTQTAGALADAYADPSKLAEITRAEAAAEAAAKAFDGVVAQ